MDLTGRSAIITGASRGLGRAIATAYVQAAAICHEANRSLCESQGDYSQAPWENSPDWQQSSAIKGVKFCLDNPDAPASANHYSWSAQKIAEGWTYGSVKDPVAKTHPCLVPFDVLPAAQQAKDYLFKSIVAGLAPFTWVEAPIEPEAPPAPQTEVDADLINEAAA